MEKGMEEIKVVGSMAPIQFDFYIVPNEYFELVSADCPHCQSSAHPERFESVEEIGSRLYGDIMMCSDCRQLYLVVDNPKIDISKPIMTRWSVPVKVYNFKNKIGYFQGGAFHEISK